MGIQGCVALGTKAPVAQDPGFCSFRSRLLAELPIESIEIGFADLRLTSRELQASVFLNEIEPLTRDLRNEIDIANQIHIGEVGGYYEVTRSAGVVEWR